MSFIGVFLDNKKFQILQKNMNKIDKTLINIKKKSIENVKNVKFDIIVISENLENFKEEINYVKNFCMKAKYLVINSDIEINCSILKEIKTNIITYGLNHKSTVTLSSITDESVLIFVQREFENMENKAIEVGEYNIKIEDATLKKLATISNGDVRTALNGLEVATLTTAMSDDGYIHLTDEDIKNSVQSKKAIFDKNGEQHYDNISAFIKSMRGSDPDAAVFYLARALNGGEDPMFLARRIVICASEDVGMANPNALVVANSAMQAVHMIGMPEARILLSEAAIYVATSKKSNASYMAINKALEDVKTKDTGEVPMHIRNAPIEKMKELGYHEGYLYPHDFPGHYVEQQYLPDKMVGTKYYVKDEK